MESPYNSTIQTEFRVNVNINGSRLRFEGTGQGNAREGKVSVDIASRSLMPAGFNPGLLSYVMITGQPDISCLLPGATNLFQEVNGEYHGIRHLNLGSFGQLATDYWITPIKKGWREAIFNITGNTESPDIVSLEPAFEVWVPQGPGLIHGHFSMVWKTADGTFIKGEVESKYHLPTDRELPGVHFRKIDFNLEVGPRRLQQLENITLFTPATANALVGA